MYRLFHRTPSPWWGCAGCMDEHPPPAGLPLCWVVGSVRVVTIVHYVRGRYNRYNGYRPFVRTRMAAGCRDCAGRIAPHCVLAGRIVAGIGLICIVVWWGDNGIVECSNCAGCEGADCRGCAGAQVGLYGSCRLSGSPAHPLTRTSTTDCTTVPPPWWG
jgi:hypothetical protein